jgi:hypothetical protein
LCCVFSRWGLTNYFSWLDSICNPPDFCLPSSWDYSREPPAPGFWGILRQ